MPSARRAAMKAIELDPRFREAQCSMADIALHFDRDWTRADQEYQAAIDAIRLRARLSLYSNFSSQKGSTTPRGCPSLHALEIDPLSLITIVWAE